MSRASATSLQRRRIDRWVAAVGLLAAAEDQRGVDVPELNAMGLLAAHAACEAMLGLIVGPLPFTKGQSSKELSFLALLEKAAPVAKPKLNQTLRGDLNAMHSVRNGFVHGGAIVHVSELDRSIEAAHTLAEHVPLPGHTNLVGVPTVVADIIEIEAIGMWLRHADEQRRAGNLRWSADGIARALDSALDRTVPHVRTRTGMTIFQTMRELGRIGAGSGFDRELRERIAEIDSLTLWVYPMALGTPPATLDYIRSVVGSDSNEDVGGHPRRVLGPSREDPSPADLRRASTIVSRIILRLWAMGSLAPGRSDEAIVKLAQPFLANPWGYAAGLPGGVEATS